MKDMRHRNANWAITLHSNGQTVSFEGAQLAVLMDIRDELQALNRLLNCHNALDIPRILRQIRANTSKPKRKVKT